jgi:RNA-directed DNA polymerase
MAYRIAGIDVHKKMLAVVVSDVEIDGQYQFERRTFGSNPEQLRSLAAWLVEHPEKTRLIEFGRFAAPNREKRGEGKPETFTFLGFTHYCGKLRSNGAFIVWRKTAKKRMVAKLHAI